MKLPAFLIRRLAARRDRRIKPSPPGPPISRQTWPTISLRCTNGASCARAAGQSITRVSAVVENLVRIPQRVSVAPDTYFVSKGNHQNMVTRRRCEFTLGACASQNVEVDATCINAAPPIPQSQDRFAGVNRVSPDLARYLEAASHTDAMTVQAGVWALTDHFDGRQIRSHLVARGAHPAISEANVEEARDILNALGIFHWL